MIGDPLQFDRHGPQRIGARRAFIIGQPFEELAVGCGVAGSRIAGDRLSEIPAAPVWSAAQRPFDTAMLVAERDFEMDYPLAMAVEAEMPGLDDPGMHRTDRHFVDFRTGD